MQRPDHYTFVPNVTQILKSTPFVLVPKSLHDLASPQPSRGISLLTPWLSVLQTLDLPLILGTHQDFSCLKTFVPFPSSPRSSQGWLLLCIQVMA